MKYQELTSAELEQTYAAGEFPASVRQAGDKVVVIMTQDWCPQWHDLASYLPDFADQAVFYLVVYNTRADFETIMDFKETTFDNREIPYLRYYYKGQLITATNWLPRTTFAALLQKTKPFRVA